MENSPGSSSNGHQSPSRVPPYFRLSSEVVEKPSDSEDSRMVPESDHIVPPESPGSNSTKSDNEGTINLLSVLSGFMSAHFPTAYSDTEGGQGDVDEGFDEEFEDKDINEAEPSHYFQLGDLDPKELQQLLDDSQLPNLEDFDLGVDVEQSHPILSPAMMRTDGYNFITPNSPFQAPSSPFQDNAGSPYHTSSPMQLHTNGYYNSFNLSESFCSEDPPASVQSNVSALTSTSTVTMQTDSDVMPDSTSNDLLVNQPVNSTTSDYQHSPQHNPILTAVTGGLDLAETSQLLSAEALMQLGTTLSEESIVDTQSMYLFGNGSAHLNVCPGGGTHVTTLLDSSMLHLAPPPPSPSSIDRHSLTSPQSPMARSPMARSPRSPMARSPVARSPPASPHRRSLSLSPTPSSKSTGQELSEEDKRLINIPYYQFRRILDDSSIPEARKEQIKNIRRRGRNKMAAKVCRTKKLSMISGLEREVELLRKAKSQMSIKANTIEREIAELKKKCLNRR